MVFREGKLAEEATWQAVVLITKGGKDYRDTGPVASNHSNLQKNRYLPWF